jgi:uncharacterized protein YcaQ
MGFIGCSFKKGSQMSFVIFHIATTKILKKKSYETGEHATVKAARAALTRAVNKEGINREEYLIMDYATFKSSVEQKIMKKSLMGGGMVEVTVNTPSYLDPSCESYWSS